MNDNHYVTGFCKTAEAAGVDPSYLVKFAKDSGILNNVKDIFGGIADRYSKMAPSSRRALNAGVLSGLGSLLFTNGDSSDRLLKMLAIGGLGGLGTYALDRTGAWNKGIDWLQDNAGALRFNNSKRDRARTLYRKGLLRSTELG